MFTLINKLPPNITYTISHKLLKYLPHKLIPWKSFCKYPVKLLCGVELINPVGLGAGIDKDGDLLRQLLNVGLGFVVVGSITLRPRKKIQGVNYVKYPKYYTMLNALGLPSRGLHYVYSKLNEVLSKYDGLTKVFVSVAGFSCEEFVKLVYYISKISKVSIIELNVSCPQYIDKINIDYITDVLKHISSITTKPILLKLSPKLSRSVLRELFRKTSKYVDGYVISNTFPITFKYVKTGIAGLSGYLLFKTNLGLIREVIRLGIHETHDIIYSGGVVSANQIIQLLKLGFRAVELVTLFTFEYFYGIYRILHSLCNVAYYCENKSK